VSPREKDRSQLEFPVKDWDKYRFISFIGEGGMGRVYKAIDTKLNRPVALKFIRGEDPDLIQRFIREARAQASVDHENVCQIYEAGEVDGKLYIAMQFIGGQTLTQMQSILTLEQKVTLIKEVAEGLHAAHRLGLIHRDIKPGNIMVERQEDGGYRPYVMDFGLVREVQSGGMTLTGTAVIGTPEYMAPEQALGDLQKMDRRVDLYSLGATFYALLSGTPPFTASSVLELLKKVLEEEPKPLSKVVRTVPLDLETIVMKCIEKEPERRYDSAKALAEDLQRYLEAEPVLARPATITYRLAKKARKNKLLVTISALASAAILILAAYGIRTELQARQKAALAQQFGQQVERMDAIMRIAHTIPLHDTRIEKQLVRQNMQEIKNRMQTMGDTASGPGNYALGRGYLSLDQYALSRKHLETAWNEGYRTPEAAYALGLAYGKLYQKELEAVENIRNKDAREARRAEIEKEYRIPAVQYLKQSRNAQTAAPEYAEGLIDFYEKRFESALRKASEAIVKIPWLYEAKILEGSILMSIANDRRAAGDTAGAMEAYANVEKAYLSAAKIGESDVETYAGLCTLWTNIMYTQIYSSGEEIGTALQKAEGACNQALLADPERGSIHTKLANSYWLWAEYQRQHGESPEAALEKSITFAREAIRLDPNDALAHKNIGTAFQMLGASAERRSADPSQYLDQAIQSYNKALNANPRDITVYNSLGNTYAIRGDSERNHGKDPVPHYQQAIETFKKGIEINPKFSYIYSNLGITYKDLGNYQLLHGRLSDADQSFRLSIQSYQKSLELKPDDVYAYNNLGNVYKIVAEQDVDRGKNPEETSKKAESALRKALEINPDYATPHSNLAEIYRIRAEYEINHQRNPAQLLEDAIRLYEKGFSINKKDPGYLMDIAVAKMMMAEYVWGSNQTASLLADAEEALSKAADIEPGDSQYFQRLGELKTLQARERIRQHKSGDPLFGEAREALNQSLAINPQNVFALRGLAESYRRQSETTDGADAQALIGAGLDAADRGLAINPGHKDILKIRAALVNLSQKHLNAKK
jgi:serine/threonine-protein kinase